MADVRCPMCSEANPEDAEVCSNCGARLKPLTVGPSDEAPEPSGFASPTPPADDSEGDVPDWLSRIRERAEADQPEEAAESDDNGPDWLSRLRAAEGEEPGPPEGEVPDWLTGDGDEEEPQEEEDWLARLRQPGDEAPAEIKLDSELAPEPTESEPDLPSEEPELTQAELESLDFESFEAEAAVFDELPLEEPAAPETTDFEAALSELEAEGVGAMDLPPEPMPEDEPAGLDLTPDELEAEQAEDAIGSYDELLAEPESGLDAEFAADDELEEFAEGALPGWMEEFEDAGAGEGDGEPAEMLSDVAEESGAPDSIPAFREAPAEPEDLQPDMAPEAEPVADAEAGEIDWEDFDWGSIAGDVDEPFEEAMPDSLGAPPEDAEEDALPHVPALIIGDEGVPSPGGADDFDLDAIELPEWLSEAQPGARIDLPESEERDLAPATIPNWLEAMRPVETFQPVVELEPEEEQVVESVGPLAGLRGVLLAEPVVAKPRTATATGARLQITERQYAQADLLRRIVEDEEREHVPGRKTALRLPLIRWLISLGLVVAAALPSLFGAPGFAPPERVSRDLGPLLEVVNQVPADRPALVVFDYDPGYTAELEGLTGALLDNLFARGMNIVTVSTRPTGPPLALELVGNAGAPYLAENGRNYVHLGYLSGGPTAVLLFSAAPREAILQGFMLPQELGVSNGWDLPILREVDQLSDFSMVAVVAAGTENARIWAEQATPWMGETPLVMVLSTGAEPLIRPYFESLDPQVDGILTGLPSAVAYERLNNRVGPANARWNSFGTSALAVELILLAGIVFGVVSWVRQLRRDEAASL